jgi:hypothetical protein
MFERLNRASHRAEITAGSFRYTSLKPYAQ